MIIQPPTLIGIAGKENMNKHAVSFAYQFTGDDVTNQSFGGVNFAGSSFLLDVSSLPTAANLSSFRCLQFSQEFDLTNLDTGALDGGLLIYVQSTQQVIRLACPPPPNGVAATTKAIISGVIPIINNSPTKVIFAKGAEFFTGDVYGLLTATLFDFDVQPYITTGFTS